MKVLTEAEAEAALARLASVARTLVAETLALDAEQARLDERRAQVLRPLVQSRDELSSALLAWAASERWPANARSRVLVHGQIGVRRSAGKLLFVKGEEHTLTVARVRGLDQLIQRSESLNKTLVRQLPPQEQQLLGVRVESREIPFLKLNTGESFTLETDGEP